MPARYAILVTIPETARLLQIGRTSPHELGRSDPTFRPIDTNTPGEVS